MTQQRRRGFEVIQKYQDQAIHLPQRSTFHAAGYDIEAAETIVLPSFWKQLLTYFLKEKLGQWIHRDTDESVDLSKDFMKPVLVPTGLKAYMQEDEYLEIVNRSSNPLKRRLVLPNGVGIIDRDYYNNDQNEGHIYVQLQNYGLTDVTIEKGERIAQGIFQTFLLSDQDTGGMTSRSGGFGSSGIESMKGGGENWQENA